MSEAQDTQPVIENCESDCNFDFNQSDTLLMEDDVICHSPSSAHSYVAERCVFIATKEEKIFNKCFGWDFYLDLLNDKIKYSLTAAEGKVVYCNFIEGTPYAAGKIVLYQGKLYEVTSATNGNQKPAHPQYFKKAKRFNNDAYNFLWDRYLCKLLAFSVMSTSVMYRLIRDTASGVVKNYQSGKSEPATLKELQALKLEAIGDIDDIVENMQNFMKRYPDCFSKYKGFQNCEKECKRKRRHYGFNTDKR